ncbi:MAG: hypothetical protein IJO62_04835 [Clostridia bacterium]|nr:hypothetical protein [Clostridia bacterium]
MEKEMHAIMNERDLEYYENRLDNLTNTCNINRKSLFGAHLTSCKGKLVSVEICSGGCRQTKSGLLLDVGEDFISIRISNAPVSTAIPIANIHSITFIHNNNCRIIR